MVLYAKFKRIYGMKKHGRNEIKSCERVVQVLLMIQFITQR